MSKFRVPLAVSFLTLILLVPPQAEAVSLHPLVGIGAEFGGDRILNFTYTDGTTSDIRAGRGVSGFGGLVFKNVLDLDSVGIDLQATAGIKYTTIVEATNGNAEFFRFPIELLVFGRWMDLRIGVGPALHVANSFSGSGVLEPYHFSYDTALGVTAQIDYTFEGHWNLGFRYTGISYTPQKTGLAPVSGSAFGGEISYLF